MAKQIIFGNEARKKIQKGLNTAANVAKTTIGPRGRNVIIGRGIMSPLISNDGLEAVKSVILSDQAENLGVEVIKDVAQKTNDKARGGRTASIILTQSIFNEGMNIIDDTINLTVLKNNIEKKSSSIIAKLKEMAIPVKTHEDIRNVATISSESSDIGNIIADAVKLIGTEGIMTVEESPVTNGTQIEITDGMKLDKGWISPYMVNNYDKMEAEYSDVAVIITDSRIKPIVEIQDILQAVGESGKRDVLIIAEDISGETLNTIILNKSKGGMNIVGIRAPGFGNSKKEILEDIATLTGASVISEEKGMTLQSSKIESVGFAKKIIVGSDSSQIIGDPRFKEKVQERIENLKKQKDGLKSKVDIRSMEERIQKLSGGAAVIKVGAATDTGMKYLKMKIEDAVNEAKAAAEEGIIPGGGSTLYNIAESMVVDGMNAEEKLACEILRNAIQSPFLQIAENAGVNLDTLKERIKAFDLNGNKNRGYDALKDVVVSDMVEYGIIDSVKVVRIALENASEAAATLLTTEVLIADENIIKKDN